MATIELVDVWKRYGELPVVKGVDLSVAQGEFIVFVGPSGCGKSTLLRMICGLEPISGGRVMIGGKPMRGVPPAKRGVAMVFQSYALYPHKTVAQNMAFALQMQGMPRAERDRRVRDVAETLQLTALLDRYPRQLSGGQRQRVAIGRAIVREPQVFLFDEPLSNLDAELRVQMRFELAKLHRSLGATMVYVTHDQTEAMTLADRIVVLRDGIVEQIGTPAEIYDNPRNRFVAGFIGAPKMSFLNGAVRARQGRRAEVAIDGVDGMVGFDVEPGIALPQQLAVGVRPEFFHVAAQGGPVLRADIEFVERLGAETYLHAPDHPAGSLIIKQAGSQAAGPAQFGVDWNKALLFDEAGVRIPANAGGQSDRTAEAATA